MENALILGVPYNTINGLTVYFNDVIKINDKHFLKGDLYKKDGTKYFEGMTYYSCGKLWKHKDTEYDIVL